MLVETWPFDPLGESRKVGVGGKHVAPPAASISPITPNRLAAVIRLPNQDATHQGECILTLQISNFFHLASEMSSSRQPREARRQIRHSRRWGQASRK
jgi:hypothetical protein